jgi:predicted dehydrogenase
MSTEKVRWGILGTGKIANRFATALSNLPDAELAAVGSRRQETADAFGEKYGVPRRHASYEALASDPDVDVVFIGTPHVYHLRDASLCFEAGKHVLCEKILTLNAREAEQLVQLAREKNLFLMEAMWTRFFPIHVHLRELLAEKRIGEIHAVQTNFFYPAPRDLENRFYKKELGASVFLDAGSYGVSFAHSLLGAPAEVASVATMGETEVDYTSACLLRYDDGPIAVIACSMVSPDVKNARIVGSEGVIDIPPSWYKPTSMTLAVNGQEPETIEYPLKEYNGYEYEAMAVMDCIREGKTECDVMPLDESLAIMRTLDTIRGQWNLEYPSE